MQPLTVIEQRFVDELIHFYDANEVREIWLILLEHRLGWSKADYLLSKNTSTNDADSKWLLDALDQLKQAKPIQYVIGYAWFLGMKLSVSESVLIPRPETEELVQLILTQQRAAPTLPRRIIDIGTGSGCIAIALQKALPEAVTYAMDISTEALRVAKTNAGIQKMPLQFIHADIRDWALVFNGGEFFDIIVSNPPYITESEKNEMHKNVLEYEPHLALFVGDAIPLTFYTHITAFATKHLAPGGRLYFEINRQYGTEVWELLHKAGFEDVQIHRDMQNADRMVSAAKQNKTT